MTTKPIIETKDLHIHYKTYLGMMEVINGVDLKVSPKEKIGIIGEAGCGKTTTMKAILDILPANATVPNGKILIKGKELAEMSKGEKQTFRRKNVAMIFEDPTASLNPVTKVGAQLMDSIKYAKIERTGETPSDEELYQEGLEILEAVALPDPERLMKSYPLELSGGMRQRIVIAMALRSGSDLIIADEPTTSLDVTIAAQILSLLGNLVKEKGISTILISHKLGAVKGMVEKVYVMYAGDIVENAPVEALFSDPLHPYTKKLLESVPRLTGAGIPEGIRGQIPDYYDPPKGCRFYPRCDSAMPICAKNKPSLMNVNGHKVRCFLYGEGKN